MTTANIERIKSLRGNAAALENFDETFKKATAHPSCDKKGFGFGRDDRFASFKVQTHFANWKGEYGNSSCGTVMHLSSETVGPYFIKALDVHRKELFATTARLMREEAAKLIDKAEAEMASMRALLDDAAQPEVSQ